MLFIGRWLGNYIVMYMVLIVQCLALNHILSEKKIVDLKYSNMKNNRNHDMNTLLHIKIKSVWGGLTFISFAKSMSS